MGEQKREFYVICRERCPECNGNGIVADDIYGEFFKQFPNGCCDVEEWPKVTQWWADRGYWNVDPKFMKGFPPEEHECPMCEGSGIRETQATLMDALKAVVPTSSIGSTE